MIHSVSHGATSRHRSAGLPICPVGVERHASLTSDDKEKGSGVGAFVRLDCCTYPGNTRLPRLNSCDSSRIEPARGNIPQIRCQLPGGEIKVEVAPFAASVQP